MTEDTEYVWFATTYHDNNQTSRKMYRDEETAKNAVMIEIGIPRLEWEVNESGDRYTTKYHRSIGYVTKEKL